jgi:aspartate/methionine/tyrosine aminotransferase
MDRSSSLVSKNVSGISLSAIKEMAFRSAKVEGAASLTWGLPSFQTPEHIRQKAYPYSSGATLF